MRYIDIAFNHHIYRLAIAKCVGDIPTNPENDGGTSEVATAQERGRELRHTTDGVNRTTAKPTLAGSVAKIFQLLKDIEAVTYSSAQLIAAKKFLATLPEETQEIVGRLYQRGSAGCVVATVCV